MNRTLIALPLALALSTMAWTTDDAMIKLATSSGCMTCHHLEPGAKGPDGLPPIGPAWKEVATKYKGQKGAISESDARKLVSWILKLQ